MTSAASQVKKIQATLVRMIGHFNTTLVPTALWDSGGISGWLVGWRGEEGKQLLTRNSG